MSESPPVRTTIPPFMNPEVAISGVWLRTLGDNIQVLVEFAGKWRLLISEHRDSAISHIAEPEAIQKAPTDEVAHGDT